MSKLSKEFIFGGVLGYFFSTNFFIFGLGFATGILIQEKFGSLYKFTQFTYEMGLSKFDQYFGKVDKIPIQDNEIINLKDKEQ